MTIRRRHAAIAIGSAIVFSILQFTSVLKNSELAVYDTYLHLRPNKERSDRLLLLDVDDTAVDRVGEWPWPRSVMAQGLLRLKEFGARAAVFDIEYVNQSPKGIDTLYFDRGLSQDFQRSFGSIASDVSDLLGAIAAGQIGSGDAAYYAEALGDLIAQERDGLLSKTSTLVRDNDVFLSQAAALYGKAWGTVSLQDGLLPDDKEEQDLRRRLAEERFGYPVGGNGGWAGGAYDEILTPIPSFLSVVKGGGFTNVHIDAGDGTRRRIALAQNVKGTWYLQLIFAPLMDLMGRPALSFEGRSLKVSGARMEDGSVRNFKIPLDPKGRMLIDWPKGTYWDEDSYRHFSFAHLAALEEEESVLDQIMLGLSTMDVWTVLDSGAQLSPERKLFLDAVAAMDAASQAQTVALAERDDTAFEAYLEARTAVRDGAASLIASDPMSRLRAGVDLAAFQYPDHAEYLASERDRAERLIAELSKAYSNIKELRANCERELRDKICIIGWVGTGTTDIGVNPFDGEYINVGTHAAVAETVLRQSFIRYLDDWVSVLLALIMVPFLVLVMGRFKVGLRTAVGFGGALFILAASYALFAGTGVFLGPLPAVLGSLMGVVTREAIDFMSTEREKSFLRKAFGTYLSSEVVEQIVADPSKLTLGGQSRFMTAMFTDIKGFSTISEQLSPEALVALLNKYLSGMSDIILDQKGTIDKYEGDAIIAFFGAPLDLPEHARNACRSAIMMKRLEAQMNTAFLAEGLTPTPLATRIGINTGDMVVGNMGTERKMNYTMMGSAVNLAARLEGVNKKYGTWILSSKATLDQAGDGFLSRRMDRVRVVGINEPVQLYEVIDLLDEASPQMRELVDRFHDALLTFEAREWQKAKGRFSELLKLKDSDGPSKYYMEACDRFLKSPPPEKWDGVFNLSEK